MKFKIRNTEVISVRIPGELYFEIIKRADLKKTTITEYVKNALIKYMEYNESKQQKDK